MQQSLLDLIIRFLAIRPRSTHEVKNRLLRYGVTDPEPILTQLVELGFLDDSTFASYLVQSRLSQHRSPRAIRIELTRHVIDPSIVESALSGINSHTIASLKALLIRRAGAPHRLSLSEKARLFRYLVSRGFVWSDIASVVKTYESE